MPDSRGFSAMLWSRPLSMLGKTDVLLPIPIPISIRLSLLTSTPPPPSEAALLPEGRKVKRGRGWLPLKQPFLDSWKIYIYILHVRFNYIMPVGTKKEIKLPPHKLGILQKKIYIYIFLVKNYIWPSHIKTGGSNEREGRRAASHLFSFLLRGLASLSAALSEATP
jgi:hypothetical protein